MQKILLVYYEPIPSGQTTHVLSLVQGLDHTRCQLTVALPEHLQDCIAQFQRCGVRVVPLKMRKILWSWQAVKTLVHLIHQEQFDLVHVHSQEAGVTGRLLASLAGARRIFYTPQTIQIYRRQWERLYILMELLWSSWTDRIISVNETDRHTLISWGIPSSKITVVPNGIDLQPFEKPVDMAQIKQNLRLDANRPVVMQVGRLAAQKNPLAFVDGAERVLRACPQAQFVMIGDGPLAEQVAAYIQKKGLQKAILLSGRQADAYQLIAAADVVTLTSDWEGTPYSLLEAMAWKKPVVSTAVNGCKEVVLHEKTGYLTAAGDIEGWAAAVTQLLENPSMAVQFGKFGRLHLEEVYTLDKMIARLEVIYRLVAGSSLENAVQLP